MCSTAIGLIPFCARAKRFGGRADQLRFYYIPFVKKQLLIFCKLWYDISYKWLSASPAGAFGFSGVIETELLTENIDRERLDGLSTLALAHVGDGVFELLARTHAAAAGCERVEQMHRSTVALVSAQAQARAAERLLPVLTEEEKAAYRRGRNAKPKTAPAHATLAEYARATGLETLFGMLYLTGQAQRILQLWNILLCGERESE